MRAESTWFLDPLLGKPIVLPVARSHWRNYIVLGSEGFFFSLSFVQRNGDIRCRYVALVPVVPADARPAISFVLFHYSQYLPLLHSDGPFTGTCIRKQTIWKTYITLWIQASGDIHRHPRTYRENCTWLCIFQWEPLFPHPQSHRQTLHRWPGRDRECFHPSALHRGCRHKQRNCVSCAEQT